jgi:hypothetical protein
VVVGRLVADKAGKRLIPSLFIGRRPPSCCTPWSAAPRRSRVALLFGFTIGNVYMMMRTTAEIFEIVSFGTVYGVVSLAGQLGSGIGLVFIGWAVDIAGGHGPVPDLPSTW